MPKRLDKFAAWKVKRVRVGQIFCDGISILQLKNANNFVMEGAEEIGKSLKIALQFLPLFKNTLASKEYRDVVPLLKK